ncbi:MAG: aspartate carbamoyltransferase catalytic subunit [Flavobacteriaceae bacterium]|nr:aspartate carbamoyltransferase [Flavobacteriaceae bacterium]|tara:strand:- start:3995 stop:4945 length:951 start_codon:yes stop_codon:yes gene_type:complete
MTTKQISINNLLGIKYLSKDDINLIFETANSFKEILKRKIKKVPTLKGITIANLFFESSTRTKLSFELAEKRLSADIINFSKTGSSISKGETLIDTVNNILAMKVDMIIIRHPSPGAAEFLTRRTNSCIINAGDGTHEHPTQGLLDTYSINEKLGSVDNKRVLILGDVLHSRVAMSNIFALKLLGAKIKVCGPKSLIPKFIENFDIKYEPNLEKGLYWCDAVNILRVQHERMNETYFPSLREYHNLYGIKLSSIKNLRKEILILHPGPINRGVEITSEVLDNQKTIVLDQVENGVAIRMAVLYLLASKKYAIINSN